MTIELIINRKDRPMTDEPQTAYEWLEEAKQIIREPGLISTKQQRDYLLECIEKAALAHFKEKHHGDYEPVRQGDKQLYELVLYDGSRKEVFAFDEKDAKAQHELPSTVKDVYAVRRWVAAA